jgi:hypothetical protein
MVIGLLLGRRCRVLLLGSLFLLAAFRSSHAAEQGTGRRANGGSLSGITGNRTTDRPERRPTCTAAHDFALWP